MPRLAHDLIYWHGRFYDPETARRVAFKPNTPVVVLASSGTELPSAPTLPAPRSPEAQLQSLETELNARHHYQIAPRGTELEVAIPAGKVLPQPPILRVRLLEDLYFFNKAGQKTEHNADFAPCRCEVIADLTGQLPPFVIIEGLSLNDLYKNAYVAFREDDGNPACDAATKFKMAIDPDGRKWFVLEKWKDTYVSDLKKLFDDKRNT
jgi:hypothetical protein